MKIYGIFLFLFGTFFVVIVNYFFYSKWGWKIGILVSIVTWILLLALSPSPITMR